MKQLNGRDVTPKIDDIILELNGSTVFSKIDLVQGFHQLVLSRDSRNLTTFATHVGLRRYKRLNFGVNAAPEIFQNEIRQVLEGLTGTLNISDDIIIHGKTRAEQDRNLETVFKRLQERNLTLNKKKCEFGKSTLNFLVLFSRTKDFLRIPKNWKQLKVLKGHKIKLTLEVFLE